MSKADEDPAQSACRGRRGGAEHSVDGRSGRVRVYLEKLPVFSTLAIREPIMGSLLHAFRIRHLDLVLDLKVARYAGLPRQLSCPSGRVPGCVADLYQVVVAGIAQDVHGATIVAVARNRRSRRVLVCAPVEAPEETGHPESKDGNGPLRGRGRPPCWARTTGKDDMECSQTKSASVGVCCSRLRGCCFVERRLRW